MREPVTTHIKDNKKDLTFKIRPLSATKAEDLILRVFLLTGKNLDFDSSEASAKNIIRALMACDHKDAKAILDELLFCCSRVEGNKEFPVSYADLDGYVENPLTLIKLRIESAKVNFGFFTDGSLQDFLSGLRS